MYPLLQSVYATLERRIGIVLQEHPLFLIALSGGTDSVALLRAMLLLGQRVEALHCNFGLRGEESDGDEEFVRDLCLSCSVPLSVQRFDTEAYAREQGLSTEMAARELRYEWFARCRRERQGSGLNTYIAVAHNADDQVETLLLNLSKGTGLRGLSGMPYRRNDGVVRPLMACKREEIEAFLHSLSQSYRTDSTNLEEVYQRNYIRHTIRPALEVLNPAFTETITQTIEHLRGVERIYLDAVERLRSRVLSSQGIHLGALKASPDPETLIYEILTPLGFSPRQCLSIAHNLEFPQGGRRYLSPTHLLIEGREYLEVFARLEGSRQDEVVLDITCDGEMETYLGLLRWRRVERSALLSLRVSRLEAIYDASKLSGFLTLRGRREGDALAPYGMSGSKKVRRIFIDGHFTHQQRQSALLLCHEDKPIWLVGHLADRRYGVGEETKVVLHCELIPILED